MTGPVSSLADDLDLIGALDFDPACDVHQCDHTAAWLIACHNEVCGCRFTYVVCDDHKTHIQRKLAQPLHPLTDKRCASCRTDLGPIKTEAEALIIDRIEPLR